MAESRPSFDLCPGKVAASHESGAVLYLRLTEAGQAEFADWTATWQGRPVTLRAGEQRLLDVTPRLRIDTGLIQLEDTRVTDLPDCVHAP